MKDDELSKLVKWLKKSKHRFYVFKSVVWLNQRNTKPSGYQALHNAEILWPSKLNYYHQSCLSCGYLAIRQLIKEGFLVNNNPIKSDMLLSLGPITDLLKEAGLMDELIS